MSFTQPRIATFKGAVSRGMAVKFGADRGHVVASGGVSDSHIGVAMSDSATDEDAVEVALPGGGGQGKLQAQVSKGALLTSHTDGTLKTAGAGERAIAMAMDDGVAGDLIPIEVLVAVIPS